MLSLKPPVPTGALEFESVFRPGGEPAVTVDELRRLSASRQALMQALVPLVAEAKPDANSLRAAVFAAEAYRDRWLPFWQNRLAANASHPPTSRTATTHVPAVFRWRVGLFHDASNLAHVRNGSTEYQVRSGAHSLTATSGRHSLRSLACLTAEFT